MHRLLTLALLLGALTGCDAVAPDGTAGPGASPSPPAAPGSSIEIHGPIQAMTASTVTVGGRVFTTTESTLYLGRDNEPLPRSAFAVGTFVEAEGTVRSDGSITTDKLKLDNN